MDLRNWEYLQNKSAWNNFFKFFFARLFAIYEFSRVLSPKKHITNNYSELICHENFPTFLSSACFIPNLIIFLLKQKNQLKFGEFWIVPACEDASVKNHPVEAGEPFKN